MGIPRTPRRHACLATSAKLRSLSRTLSNAGPFGMQLLDSYKACDLLSVAWTTASWDRAVLDCRTAALLRGALSSNNVLDSNVRKRLRLASCHFHCARQLKSTSRFWTLKDKLARFACNNLRASLHCNEWHATAASSKHMHMKLTGSMRWLYT